MHRSNRIRPARRNRVEYECLPSLTAGDPSHAKQTGALPLVPGAQNAESEMDLLREDVFGAAQLQHLLNGPRQVRRGDFDLACESFPVGQISGDFCTVFDVGDRTIFALGDIAGKGLTAGMWFTHIVSLVRIHAQITPDPAKAISEMNRELCSLHLERPLITVFLGSLDWSSNELSYCRAGHPPPVLFQGKEGPRLAHEGGPVLGVVKDAEFETGTAELGPGEGLLAYTDGFSELCNEDGEEFGIGRLLDEVGRCERSSAPSLLFCMLAAAKDFAGFTQPHDDLTMMALLRNNPR